MKKILTIQDISCVGQCSLTVALPIISAFGIETAIIPTAVLSTHTAFSNFTFCDLTNEMPKIEQEWHKQQIQFDGFYTGYIGSIEQIKYIMSIFESTTKKNALRLVDPCMADHGKLYPGFDETFPSEMLKLCKVADVIVPNLTEACLLLGIPYQNYDFEALKEIVRKLHTLTKASVVLTGVSKVAGELGALAYDGATYYDTATKHIPLAFHGTGDCFASALFGAMIKGYSLFDATKIACEFTYLSVSYTESDAKEHWYGVHFEKALGYITGLDLVTEK